jgi:hypothetical protein
MFSATTHLARRSAVPCYCAPSMATASAPAIMDPLLIVLLGLLLASLLAFFSGFIPYPFGLIVLTALIAARVLYLRGPRQ